MMGRAGGGGAEREVMVAVSGLGQDQYPLCIGPLPLCSLTRHNPPANSCGCETWPQLYNRNFPLLLTEIRFAGQAGGGETPTLSLNDNQINLPRTVHYTGLS